MGYRHSKHRRPINWRPRRKASKVALKLIGSVLISVMITILLSRIEETQFFIKVSVSDFWGSIAIGFLANYGGWPLLKQIVPVSKKQIPHSKPVALP